VLVVDDEEDVVTFLRTALEDAGFQVEAARSVDEALSRVRAGAPDCISLDMVMPGKSGIVLFHELRRHRDWARIPVIFVTAHAADRKVRGDLDGALADSTMCGPATYLEKPVTAENYVRAMADVLKVELGGAEPVHPDVEHLKQDLQRLAEGADPDALKRALEILRNPPAGRDDPAATRP
jgi:CheY-like chemotaxis protein